MSSFQRDFSLYHFSYSIFRLSKQAKRTYSLICKQIRYIRHNDDKSHRITGGIDDVSFVLGSRCSADSQRGDDYKGGRDMVSPTVGRHWVSAFRFVSLRDKHTGYARVMFDLFADARRAQYFTITNAAAIWTRTAALICKYGLSSCWPSLPSSSLPALCSVCCVVYSVVDRGADERRRLRRHIYGKNARCLSFLSSNVYLLFRLSCQLYFSILFLTHHYQQQEDLSLSGISLISLYISLCITILCVC